MRKKLHYSWIVCLGCVLVFFCTCGLSLNLYPVYQPFMITEFGFTKTQIALLNTVRRVANILSLAVLQVFYKKLNLRKGLLVSGLITISSYYIYGFAREFPFFVVGNFLAGFGYGLSCMVPMSMLLERWFKKDLTLAVSICSAASGMATVGIPSVVTASIEKNGIGKTFLTEGILMTFIVLIGFLIIRDFPGQMHLQPFGEGEEEQADGKKKPFPGSEKGLGMGALFPAFVMVLFMGGICGPGWNCISLLATTQGYSSSVMALTVSLAGAALMIGKFLFGGMAEKLSLKTTTLWFSVTLIAGGALLALSGVGTAVLFLGSVLYAGSLSMITIGQVSWTMDWSAPKDRGLIKRIFALLYAFGAMIFELLPGIVADATGSYVPTYILFTVLSVICFCIVLATYRKAEKQKAS